MTNRSWASLVCAGLMAAASTSQATVYFQNEGDKTGWPNYPQNPQNLGRIDNVTSPVFKGSTAIAFEQTYVSNATERYHSEVTYHTVQRTGQDRYYGFAMRLDSNWQLTDLNRDTWQQWGRENPGGPWLLYRLDRDRVRVTNSGPAPSMANAASFPLTRGVWYSIVTRIRMTTSGVMEMWWDGARRWSVAGDYTVPGDTVRWSAGLYVSYWYDSYRDGLPSGYQRVRRLYQDHYRIASSYAEAEPANWGTGGTVTPTPTPGGSNPTPTPTPTPTPSGTGTTFEAESLSRIDSGTGTTTQTDANASGGQWVSLDAENSGSWIELTTPAIAAGTYTVRMRYKTNSNRGQLTLRVDGTQVGGTLDQYASSSSYMEATFGTVSLGAGGTHKIRLTAVGKSSSSSSYVLSADRFTFAGGSTATPTPTPTATPSSSTPTPTPAASALSYEAESLTVTHSGSGTTRQTDANASGGAWISLNATGAGSWIELTLPNVPAGTYSLRLSYKTNSNRGQLDLRADGLAVGGILDQYASPSTYPTATFGTVSFASPGSHLVRLRVTGKNASSSGYVLSADKFTLTPQ